MRRLLLLGVVACSGESCAKPDAASAPPGLADAAGTVDATPRLTVAECLADDFVTPPSLGADYDQFAPVIGSHCLGTDHQDIADVERVVFLGDSITVGTPPTLVGDLYRVRLAHSLATRFDLEEPDFLWDSVDPFTRQSGRQDSGAFASCARWGGRSEDLSGQLVDCFPPEKRDRVTLVFLTIGGNDLQDLVKSDAEGATIDSLWSQAQQSVANLREAIEWFGPGQFPRGVYVVFANIPEFTDATGDAASCPGANLAGFGDPTAHFDELAAIVVWMNEQYLKIAVDAGRDMVFSLEQFCGHGYHHDDPSAPCYRGPGTERWFDLTCVHPNPTGHAQLSSMFSAVVDE